MTMVPAPKLSKPHLIFYGGCGGGGGGGGGGGSSPEVMSRFGDGIGGGSYGNINGGNINNVTDTADNIINKIDNSSNNNNKVISSVLGSDLVIGHHHHLHNPNNNNIVGMADEEQRQRPRNSNTSFNNDDGSSGGGGGGDIRQSSRGVKTREDGDDVMDGSSWLQLGLGGGGSGTHLISSNSPQIDQQAPPPGLMLELNLGGLHHHHQTTPFQMQELDPRIQHDTGGVVRGSASGTTTFISPHHHHHAPPPLHHQQQLLLSSLSQQSQLYLLHQQQQVHQQQQGWGYVNQTTATLSPSMSPSSSSSLHPQQPVLLPAQGGVGPFLTRPFTPSGSSFDGSDSEFRIIHPPPRRPHSGIWFSLHASPHQSKEPFLPQVSKNFLRIKDGRMTVRLVMKYVANKLGLNSESEVEIRCRGQQLVPYLTLQHVRDNIWSPREAAVTTVTLLPDSSTSDHVMVLNYGRSTTSSAYVT